MPFTFEAREGAYAANSLPSQCYSYMHMQQIPLSRFSQLLTVTDSHGLTRVTFVPSATQLLLLLLCILLVPLVADPLLPCVNGRGANLDSTQLEHLS